MRMRRGKMSVGPDTSSPLPYRRVDEVKIHISLSLDQLRLK